MSKNCVFAPLARHCEESLQLSCFSFLWEGKILPSWSLEEKSSSWWLLLSWRAKDRCGQNDRWPFPSSFPESSSCSDHVSSAPSRNSMSSPNDLGQPLAPPLVKLITSHFSLEDVWASLVIRAWNLSATAPLETKPLGGWLMAWQIIRRRKQKESGEGNQQSAGLTDKY